MTSELKELLTKVYTSCVEANNRRWEYLTLPLDDRYKIMQDYIKEMKLSMIPKWTLETNYGCGNHGYGFQYAVYGIGDGYGGGYGSGYGGGYGYAEDIV